MQEQEYTQVLVNDQRAAKLACLPDSFVHLNKLNRQMQHKNENILSIVDKTEGFRG